MIDLSSKVTSFKKMVWDSEKAKSEKDLYNSTNSSGKTIDGKKSNLDKKLAAYLEKRKVFADAKKNERLAKRSEEEKEIYYRYREELLDQIIGEIEGELKKYAQSEAYRKDLPAKALESLKSLSKEGEDDLVIAVRAVDADLFKKGRVDILDDSAIGGYVIRDREKSFEYDFTLRKKLEDQKYEIGKKLYQSFEKSEEDNE